MNVTATPNDTLGRMLHSFSGNAIETNEEINILPIVSLTPTPSYSSTIKADFIPFPYYHKVNEVWFYPNFNDFAFSGHEYKVRLGFWNGIESNQVEYEDVIIGRAGYRYICSKDKNLREIYSIDNEGKLNYQ
jgi:hypothetical protein